MEIKSSYIFILFIIVVVLLGVSLYKINLFMPILESCDDDFEIIDKCNCVPWTSSLTFPNQIKNKNFTLPNG